MIKKELAKKTRMLGIPDPHQKIVDQYMRKHNPSES